MALDDSGFRSALLEVLRNVVRIYRNKIVNAGQAPDVPPVPAGGDVPEPSRTAPVPPIYWDL